MLTPIFKRKHAATLRRQRKTIMTGILIAGLTLFSVTGILPTGMAKDAKALVVNGVEVRIDYPNTFISPQIHDVYGTAKVVPGGGETFDHYSLWWKSESDPFATWYNGGLTVSTPYSEVTGGKLGTFDATTFAPGNYTLRVEVNSYGSGAWHYNSATMPITIDSDMGMGWPKLMDASNQYLFNYLSPVVADLNNTGNKQIVVATDYGDLHVYEKSGLERSGFPISSFTGGSGKEISFSPPTVDDIEGNTSKEIAFVTVNQSCNSIPCTGTVRVIKHDGTLPSSWTNQVISVGSVNNSTPVLADIDNNGKRDVMVTEYVSATSIKIHAYKYNGGEVTGFPKTVTVDSKPLSGALSVADMDGDGNKEIALADVYKVYLYDKTGTIVSGWPKSAGTNPYNSPALDLFHSQPTFGNIDSDADLELVAMSTQNNGAAYGGIYAWDKNGTLLTGLPVYTDTEPTHNGVGRLFFGASTLDTISLADVDNDGKDEIAVGAMQNQVYDYTGSTLSLKYSEDTVNSGFAFPDNYVSTTSPAIADVDGDGAFDYTTAFGPHIGIMKADGTRSFSRMFDNTGASYVFGGPVVLSDLDGDNKLELIGIRQTYQTTANRMNKHALYVWTIPTATPCSVAQYDWPMMGQNSSRSGRLSVPTPPSGASGNCLQVYSGGDTHVKQASPTSTYGTRDTVDIDYNSSSAEERGFMKFDLTSLSAATISSAKLKLYITSDSSATQTMKLLNTGDSNFNEATMTWNNKPTPSATTVGTITAPNDGQWVTIDITSSATARKGGWLAFDIETTSSSGLSIASKDNVNPQFKPYLEVTY
jgi:hypothetical protein